MLPSAVLTAPRHVGFLTYWLGAAHPSKLASCYSQSVGVTTGLRCVAAFGVTLAGFIVLSGPVAAHELVLMHDWAGTALNSAVVSSKVDVGPAEACKAAVDVAELGRGLPAGLLLAIARVETGRRDAKTGMLEPWPWSVNAQGQSLFFPTKALAVDWVRQAQKAGMTSIDVGCMQVNLQYHPLAFHTLEDAFDPEHNARYAVAFLSALYGEVGDWMRAAGLYHSRNDMLAAPYRQQVAINVTQPRVASEPALPTVMQTLRTAWGATLQPIGMDEPAQHAMWSVARSGPNPAKPQ